MDAPFHPLLLSGKRLEIAHNISTLPRLSDLPETDEDNCTAGGRAESRLRREVMVTLHVQRDGSSSSRAS